MLVAVSGLTAGCGGISASKTVSPLDFIMPGILRADPVPAPSSPAVPAAKIVQV
jgi:hypothetical protein